MSDLPVFEGVDIDSLEASDELFANMALLNLFRPTAAMYTVHQPVWGWPTTIWLNFGLPTVTPNSTRNCNL
jgi:hypothetical protein